MWFIVHRSEGGHELAGMVEKQAYDTEEAAEAEAQTRKPRPGWKIDVVEAESERVIIERLTGHPIG